jgi:hypothetical protein
MITRKYFAAILGFAFVAAWIGVGFGNAVLCLLGAGIFYAIVSFLEGDLDLADFQGRLRSNDANPTAPPARPRPRARVQ